MLKRLLILPFASLLTVLSASAFAADLTIPKVIYHYGTYEILEKNVEAKTIPAEDWDRYIMGDATRYGQKWYRRGLYGSVHPAYSAYFSDIGAGNGKQQWLMAVELTETCRAEKPINLDLLYEDERVGKYIQAHPNSAYRSLSEFRDQCYPYYAEFKQRIPNLEVITGTGELKPCEAFVNTMFIDLKPKIVMDSAWPGSWYLRDRNCIETISGTPSEVAKMLTLPGFWSNKTPSGELREGSPTENSSGLSILMKVLTSADAFSDTSPQQLLNAVGKSDMRNTRGWEPGNEKPGWMAKIGTGLIRKYLDCEAKSTANSFRTNLSALLLELNQSKNFDATAEMILEKVGC